jgi:hypothetical protein
MTTEASETTRDFLNLVAAVECNLRGKKSGTTQVQLEKLSHK